MERLRIAVNFQFNMAHVSYSTDTLSGIYFVEKINKIPQELLGNNDKN